MPGPDDKLERFKTAFQDGTMDGYLQSGEWDQARYDRNVAKLAEAGFEPAIAKLSGAPAAAESPAAKWGYSDAPPPPAEGAAKWGYDPSAPAPAPKPPTTKDVATDAQLKDGVAPSAYVGGVGDAVPENGPWWDNAMKSIPQAARDATLVPSYGPVWFEPSDEEVNEAVAGQVRLGMEENTAEGNAHMAPEFDDLGDRLAPQVDAVADYRDKKWNEAYAAARARGESIYRARDITDKSPGFMRAAKAAAERMRPIEAAVRGVDRAVTGGIAMSGLDTSVGDASVANAEAQAAAQRLGMQDEFQAPPWDPEAASSEDMVARGESETRRRTKNTSDLIEQHPFAYAGGNLAGALAPGGLTGMTSRFASKALGSETSRGLAGGFFRGAGAAGLGDFAAEMGAQQVDNQVRQAGGQEELGLDDQASAAGMQATVSAALGGALSLPGAVSRRIRGAGDSDASALASLDEAGGGTAFGGEGGLRPPPEHAALADEFKQEGSAAGAKSNAAKVVADDVMGRARIAGAQVDADASAAMRSFVKDADVMHGERAAIADDIVGGAQSLDRGVNEQAASFTKKFMDRANAHIQEGITERQGQNEAMLKKSGAPDYQEIPGPTFHISDAEEEMAKHAAKDSGLKTPYPSVSLDKVIRADFGLIQRMAFYDGTNLPNAPSVKFKKAVDSLFRKKVVPASEAENYASVAYDMRDIDEVSEGGLLDAGGKPVKRKMVEILLPRLVSARELDDFIKTMDEFGKFPNSPAPEAARFRELGAAATKLREEGFKELHGMKLRHHELILEDERMFRALGLQRSTDEIDSMDVDQVGSVMNNIKAYASTPDELIPAGLGVGRREFENWLARADEGLYDEYTHLRDLYRQKRRVNDFNIAADIGPKTRAASLQTLEDMITGKNREYDAMMEAFGGYGARIKAARSEATRQNDLFTTLGVDTSNLTPGEIERAALKLREVIIDGKDEFTRVRNAMKPEMRQALDTSQKAAADIDSMFGTLGFTKDRNQPRWATAEHARVQDGIFNILDAYKSYGSDPRFNDAVDKLFASNTGVKKALVDMAGTRAYQILRRQTKEGTGVAGNLTNVHWYMSAKDFFKFRMDALMGSSQHGLLTGRAKGSAYESMSRSPVGAPTEYAGAMTESTDRDKVGDVAEMTGTKMTSTALLNAMIAATDRLRGDQ